ncbi:hypothetical protein [Methylobacterium indicum]|uniref:Uncharacterized protein n=1 Tax=Methylobacterium indicum TaxID=1775910 RepID=A0A8H8WSH3_9HYPH|nr:hypothetical protein [Methylobacterium indicum]BCM83576.1 hypothetical protein mvi_20370 [Methylobacterium indicum]
MQLQRGADAPFSFRYAAPEAAIEALGLEPGRTKADRAVQAAVIAAAAIEHDGEGRWISYSRSHDWWAAGRYEGTPVTMKRVINAVEGLARAGLVESFVQMPGAHLLSNEAERVQSAFRAWPALVNRLGGLRLDPVKRPPVIMKDEAGNRIAFPRTERGARATREVEDLNTWFAGFDVEVDPGADPANWKRTAYHLHGRKVRKDGSETWACTVPTPVPQVVRIFGRGRLDRHGRLYGWWQGLPKDRRGELLLNGEVLIEEDFASLHPTLLYAMKGIRLDFDPYDVWGFPRQHGKWALNIGVNADGGLKGAVDALMAKPDWTESWTYTRKLVDEVAKRNEPIREFLGSDAGVRLMAIDSRMALDVLKACRKADIPALPVHDSFMAPGGKAGQVRAIMGEVLDKTRVTISPKTSVSSALPFLHNAPLVDPSLSRPSVEVAAPAGEGSSVPPASPPVLVPAPVVEGPPAALAVSRPVLVPAPLIEGPGAVLPGSYEGSTALPRVSTPSLAPAVLAAAWSPQDVPPGPSSSVSAPDLHRSSWERRTAPSTSPPFPDPFTRSLAVPDRPCAMRLDMTASRPVVVTIPDPHPHRIWDVDGSEVRGAPVMLRPMAEDLIAQGHDPYARPAAPPPKVAPGLPSGIVPRGA